MRKTLDKGNNKEIQLLNDKKTIELINPLDKPKIKFQSVIPSPKQAHKHDQHVQTNNFDSSRFQNKYMNKFNII